MKLLPFDFDRIKDGSVLLVNISGETIYLNNKEFEILCNEDFEWLDDNLKN